MKKIFTKRHLQTFLKWLGIVVGTLVFIAIISFASIKLGCNTTLSPETLAVSNHTETEAITALKKNELKDYFRDEESTYLTYPEWYIVYSAHEYADGLKSKPSSFPYLRATAQFWCGYDAMNAATKQYGYNGDRQLMLSVIGVSFSAENIFKSVYENTIGRVSEFLAFGAITDEDTYAQKVADDYANFLHTIPWYEYPYGEKLKGLWTETSFFGPGIIRKAERKTILTIEYSVKATYAALIKKATKAIFVPPPLSIQMLAQDVPYDIALRVPGVTLVKQIDPYTAILELPRYEEFTKVIITLAEIGLEFVDIAGNNDIFVTLIAQDGWISTRKDSYVMFDQPILTQPGKKRVGVRVPVSSLQRFIRELQNESVVIEHVYDY